MREGAEMFSEQGFTFTHAAVREWEARFTLLLPEHLRAKRQGQAGSSCSVDEKDIKVTGQWCELYRARDREGNLVDSMLSRTRDRDAA